MSEQDFQSLFNAALQPSFVPAEPVTLKQIGFWAYERDYSPELHWPDGMRQGWMRALHTAAWADTTAYLVAQGGAL